jgi:hypothetical protein
MRGLAKCIGLAVCLFTLFAPTLYARTWFVPSECPTIKAGLDSAAHSDTVMVEPGIYLKTEDPETWISPGPGVRLASLAGPDSTTIEVCGGTVGIGLSHCEGASVSGFSIRPSPSFRYGSAPSHTKGISCFECTYVQVDNCKIEWFTYGVYVSGESTSWGWPIFRDNVIHDCVIGISCLDVYEPSRPLFQGNDISQCGWAGVEIDDSAPDFDGNRITYCDDYGMVYGYHCGGNCTRNVIAHNDGFGVWVWSDPPLACPWFNGGWEPEMANDFYDNGDYDIWYAHSGTDALLMAIYNYWGTDCPDFANCVYGRVKTSPWVDSTHSEVYTECPHAAEPTTWGSIKAIYR